MLADLKIMDAGEHEASLAFAAGADIVTVLGLSADSTVSGAVAAARAAGGGRLVMADMIGGAEGASGLSRCASAAFLNRKAVPCLAVFLGPLPLMLCVRRPPSSSRQCLTVWSTSGGEQLAPLAERLFSLGVDICCGDKRCRPLPVAAFPLCRLLGFLCISAPPLTKGLFFLCLLLRFRCRPHGFLCISSSDEGFKRPQCTPPSTSREEPTRSLS